MARALDGLLSCLVPHAYDEDIRPDATSAWSTRAIVHAYDEPHPETTEQPSCRSRR
ncbi:hypothetical protein ACF08O_25860 [Streptomyces paradoxus]|uniref:hypothetical protein n=1 Tax=Streptomyces paradoxus TaxID=66375 RepID=UPI0036F880CA